LKSLETVLEKQQLLRFQQIIFIFSPIIIIYKLKWLQNKLLRLSSPSFLKLEPEKVFELR